MHALRRRRRRQAARRQPGRRRFASMRHARRATGRSTVHEVREEPARSGSADLVREREGERLLAAVPPGAQVVACELTGRSLTSEQFARMAAASCASGRATSRFVIGGAFGLGRCREAARDDVARARAVDAAARARATRARRAAVSRRHDRARRAVPQVTRVDARAIECDRMTEPIVITESLGGSPLSRAARAGALPQWYRAAPRDADEWQRVRARRARERVGADWLDDARAGDRARPAPPPRDSSASAGGDGRRRHDRTAARACSAVRS